MPSAVVRKFAAEYAERHEIDEEEAVAILEGYWDKAKSLAKDSSKFEEENDAFWAYVMGIWKRMSGYDSDSVEASTGCRMLSITITL